MSAPKLLRPILLAAALAALIGCGKNLPTSVIVPTGYRPGTPPGAIFGQVAYDSTIFPGLNGQPFPYTRVELHTFHRDTLGPLVAVQTIGGESCTYAFTGLMPDSYLVQLRPHAFNPRDVGPFRVELDPVTGPTAGLIGNTTVLENAVFLLGSMPGFRMEEYFNNFLNNPIVGVWYYPDILMGPTPIAAGTYRFKFATDFSSTDDNRIGWGGDSTVTLTAPVTGVPARKGAGPATDIKVTIPTSGNWAFEFDERRTTFSITPVTDAVALRAARARTPR